MSGKNVAESRLAELTVTIEQIKGTMERLHFTDPVHQALKEKLHELRDERDILINKLAF